MERHWEAVSEWLGRLLTDQGVDRISAEELTVPPGMDELFSLLRIKQHHDEGEFDVVIVDCAPTGETLRLLSFPDVCRWWLEKVFPWQGKLMAAARPLARGVPLPGPGGVRRRRAPGAQPGGHERDPARRVADVDPAGHEPRPDGGARVDAHVHLPEPVRLPDRRGGGEPDPPRGGGQRLLPGLARGPAGAHGAGALGLRPGAGADRAVDAHRGVGPRAAGRAGRGRVRRHRGPRRAARGADPGADRRERPRPPAAGRCRWWSAATSS